MGNISEPLSFYEPRGETWRLDAYCDCRACKGGPNRHTRAFINYLKRNGDIVERNDIGPYVFITIKEKGS